MSRKVVLCTVGSLGDLHPFIALAKSLKELGLRPAIATSAAYRSKVESEALEFIPVRPDEDEIVRRLGMSMADLVARLTTDDGFLLREILLPFLPVSYADVLPAVQGADLVVAHPLAEPAKLAAEKLGVPQVSVMPVPALLLSAHDPPRLGPMRLIREPRSELALACNRGALRLLRGAMGIYARRLQRFRREIGLPPSRAAGFIESPRALATIGLFSPMLASGQPDHPRETTIVGFPFYDGAGAADLPPEVERFLAAGSAPIVVTLGSFAVLDGDRFFRAAIEAVRRLGRRAVVVAREVEQRRLAPLLSPDILVCGYVPYSRVFPHAAAVLHHAGIGTSAQALRAGKPQLLVPFFGDQHDNAQRLERLGVARRIGRRWLTPARAAAELESLLGGPTYVRRAAEISGTVAREDGPAAAARVIHATLREHLAARASNSAAA